MTAFYVGDVPAQSLVIEPALDMTPFDGATVNLISPDPAAALQQMTATLDQDEAQIIAVWPAGATLDQAGVWKVHVTITRSAGGAQFLGTVQIIVDPIDDGWHTLASARDDWRDADQMDDPTLHDLLEVAKGQVVDYAPALDDGAAIPTNYKTAQLMQARNIRNAQKVNPANGQLGEDTFVVQPYPLDWMVKQQLRPKRGIPVVG